MLVNQKLQFCINICVAVVGLLQQLRLQGERWGGERRKGKSCVLRRCSRDLEHRPRRYFFFLTRPLFLALHAADSKTLLSRVCFKYRFRHTRFPRLVLPMQTFGKECKFRSRTRLYSVPVSLIDNTPSDRERSGLRTQPAHLPSRHEAGQRAPVSTRVLARGQTGRFRSQ